ncbi:hypothetical protein AB0G15_14890 [Streptosporangium sp. NPDC023825]|uniref:hypothetical protein n=1 Tax=Streptosporangium sp. NPDC023825 TaxID=3154909 RepID=UPI00342E9669
MRVTPDYVADDPGLRAFVEQEYEHVTYHVVHLSISFAAEPRTPRLSTADVKLALSSTSTSVEPVAWSMTPKQVTDVAQVERRFTLGPQLSLLGADVSLGEIGRTTSKQRTDVFLQARNELRANPEWAFTSTKTMAINGSYRLILVVRGARESATGISVTISASTEGNLLRRYGRTLPDPLRLAAVL